MLPEQQYFDIEKQLVESNNKLQSEAERATRLATQLAELGMYFSQTTGFPVVVVLFAFIRHE